MKEGSKCAYHNMQGIKLAPLNGEDATTNLREVTGSLRKLDPVESEAIMCVRMLSDLPTGSVVVY